jgi:protein-S-isoprenylcysteine O-methyltransferase Ste14
LQWTVAVKQYVSVAAMGFGMAIMLHSAVTAALVGASAVLTHFIILEEERWCSTTYGESYVQYKRKVPRYFLFF